MQLECTFFGFVSSDPVQRTRKEDQKHFVTFDVSRAKANGKKEWIQIICNGRVSEFAIKFVKSKKQVFIIGSPYASFKESTVDGVKKSYPKLLIIASKIEVARDIELEKKYNNEDDYYVVSASLSPIEDEIPIPY